MNVLLVSMPFAALNAPSTALSLLKSQLVRSGITCHVAYLGMAMADVIGGEDYELIVGLPGEVLAGEWVFASCLALRSRDDEDRYFKTVASGLRMIERQALERARKAADGFLAAQLDDVAWADYDIVGFTSSCDQNLASLAMARRVKAFHSQTVIAFGGANWEAEMGLAALRLSSYVDIAFLGEADLTLPLVVDRLARGTEPGILPLDDVPGIAFRDDRGVVKTSGEAVVQDLDGLPAPDFSDFFSARDATTLGSPARDVHLWLQGSRGCWWAEAYPCRFCGLNGTRRVYRTKSPRRFLDEIEGVTGRWPGCQVDVADTVVPAAVLDECIPEFARHPLGVPLSLEVRPELRRDQVRALAQAGAQVQVGIESLSDDVLRLMRKGTQVLECLRLLKWCRDEKLPCSWNILYDIPGERNEHLLEMARLIPALHSLPGPTMCIPMQLDRFSPFFDQADAFGIEDVQPAEAYGLVYPWSEADLRRVAYVFDFRRDRSLLRGACLRQLQDEVKRWQEAAGQVDLTFRPRDEAAIVEMREGTVERVVEVDDLDMVLCSACDDIAGLDSLLALPTCSPDCRSKPSSGVKDVVIERLQRLVDEGIMIGIGGRFLSIPACAGVRQGDAD
ncbi:MAG TPA: RiPP maturation radical SAM C-methyltransferase [Thermoleophilia bacterium]|nr:RiPP maturation radical SAM C-methyltransferase [Thermoleophilia bacterium]